MSKLGRDSTPLVCRVRGEERFRSDPCLMVTWLSRETSQTIGSVSLRCRFGWNPHVWGQEELSDSAHKISSQGERTVRQLDRLPHQRVWSVKGNLLAGNLGFKGRHGWYLGWICDLVCETPWTMAEFLCIYTNTLRKLWSSSTLVSWWPRGWCWVEGDVLCLWSWNHAFYGTLVCG